CRRIRLHEQPENSRIQLRIQDPEPPGLVEAKQSPEDFHSPVRGSQLPARRQILQLSTLMWPHLWKRSTRHRTKTFLREQSRHNDVALLREWFLRMIRPASFPSE